MAKKKRKRKRKKNDPELAGFRRVIREEQKESRKPGRRGSATSEQRKMAENIKMKRICCAISATADRSCGICQQLLWWLVGSVSVYVWKCVCLCVSLILPGTEKRCAALKTLFLCFVL